MEVLNDDKVLLTGGKSDGSLVMTRLLANGQIDTSFGLNGYLDEKESKNFGVLPNSVGWGRSEVLVEILDLHWPVKQFQIIIQFI